MDKDEMLHLLAESIIESVDSFGISVNWMFRQRYLDAVEKGIRGFCTENDVDIHIEGKGRRSMFRKTEKFSFGDFRDKMFLYNSDFSFLPPIQGVVVFTEDSFLKQYSLESRSYLVSSDNKAFRAGNYSSSLFGSALDGSDNYVKISEYMRELSGGEDGWKVDYCYFTLSGGTDRMKEGGE